MLWRIAVSELTFGSYQAEVLYKDDAEVRCDSVRVSLHLCWGGKSHSQNSIYKKRFFESVLKSAQLCLTKATVCLALTLKTSKNGKCLRIGGRFLYETHTRPLSLVYVRPLRDLSAFTFCLWHEGCCDDGHLAWSSVVTARSTLVNQPHGSNSPGSVTGNWENMWLGCFSFLCEGWHFPHLHL